MGNVIYGMIIFIFILGAGVSYFNESGLYDHIDGGYNIPESGIVSPNSSQAESLNNALIETSKDSGLNYLEMLSLIGKTVFGGLVAIFTLGPLLVSLGIPIPMVAWLLSPMGIVLVFWLIEMWLGRPAE